jgi:hypothetical protein
MSNNLLSLSGAQLRALQAKGDNHARAELTRRQLKRAKSGHVTVAALRSWGRTTEATTLIAQAKASKATKAVPAKPTTKAVPPVPFTSTSEAVATPKSASAHLHNRLAAVENAVLELGALARSQSELLSLLTAKLLAQA